MLGVSGLGHQVMILSHDLITTILAVVPVFPVDYLTQPTGIKIFLISHPLPGDSLWVQMSFGINKITSCVILSHYSYGGVESRR